MSGEGKWKTVGGKKGGRSFQNDGGPGKAGDSGRAIGGGCTVQNGITNLVDH